MLWRLRTRHVHIPHRAPHYTPLQLPFDIQFLLQSQIEKTTIRGDRLQKRRQKRENTTERRSAGQEEKWTSLLKPNSEVSRDDVAEFLSLASPPPTVISFTPDPTFSVSRGKHPKDTRENADRLYHLTQRMLQPLRVKFPHPPPADDGSEGETSRYNEADSGDHDPLDYVHSPNMRDITSRSSFYNGPGQLNLWPVLDLKDTVQLGSFQFKGFWAYESLLADTTIAMLQREFGITAFKEMGREGLWVESFLDPIGYGDKAARLLRGGQPDVVSLEHMSIVRQEARRQASLRRIATFHAICGPSGYTSYGVVLNISHPQTDDASPTTIDGTDTEYSPSARIAGADHKRLTSIAAEVAARESRFPSAPMTDEAGSELTGTGTVWRLINNWAKARTSPHQIQSLKSDLEFARRGAVDDAAASKPSDGIAPVLSTSKLITEALLTPDNYPIAVSWTHEFARQIGMDNDNAIVEHLELPHPREQPWAERPVSPQSWREVNDMSHYQAAATVQRPCRLPTTPRVTVASLADAKERYGTQITADQYTVVGKRTIDKGTDDTTTTIIEDAAANTASEEELSTMVIAWPALQNNLKMLISRSTNGRNADTRLKKPSPPQQAKSSNLKDSPHRSSHKSFRDASGRRTKNKDYKQKDTKGNAPVQSLMGQVVRKTGKTLREELEKKWAATVAPKNNMYVAPVVTEEVEKVGQDGQEVRVSVEGGPKEEGEDQKVVETPQEVDGQQTAEAQKEIETTQQVDAQQTAEVQREVETSQETDVQEAAEVQQEVGTFKAIEVEEKTEDPGKAAAAIVEDNEFPKDMHVGAKDEAIEEGKETKVKEDTEPNESETQTEVEAKDNIIKEEDGAEVNKDVEGKKEAPKKWWQVI